MLLHSWPAAFLPGQKLSKAVSFSGSWDWGWTADVTWSFDGVTATDPVKRCGCCSLPWASGLTVELVLCKSTSAAQLSGIQVPLQKEHGNLLYDLLQGLRNCTGFLKHFFD